MSLLRRVPRRPPARGGGRKAEAEDRGQKTRWRQRRSACEIYRPESPDPERMPRPTKTAPRSSGPAGRACCAMSGMFLKTGGFLVLCWLVYHYPVTGLVRYFPKTHVRARATDANRRLAGRRGPGPGPAGGDDPRLEGDLAQEHRLRSHAGPDRVVSRRLRPPRGQHRHVPRRRSEAPPVPLRMSPGHRHRHRSSPPTKPTPNSSSSKSTAAAPSTTPSKKPASTPTRNETSSTWNRPASAQLPVFLVIGITTEMHDRHNHDLIVRKSE